ncbi:MAG: hypothetical protein R3C53_08820 [Pirellulaceae bacterium]
MKRGHTLLEMVAAMTAASILMGGLSAAVIVTSKAFRPESTAMHAKTTSNLAQGDLLNDLRLATSFSERTNTAATFKVPDRDGDGLRETLRYAWSGTQGDPLTLSYNGSAPFVVANDVRHFSLNYLTTSLATVALPAEATGSSIALFVNDSSSPSAEELQRKAVLESWDFQVTLIGFNDGEDAILKTAAAVKAVYLSGTLEAGNFEIGPALSELSVGVVNEHPDLVDEFGFAESVDSSFSSSIDVAEGSHYIMADLQDSRVSFSILPVTVVLLDSESKAELNILATAGFRREPAVVTIDPNDLLCDGRQAAGRRVMIPWGSSKANQLFLNNTGLKLTQKAVEWATGLGEESATTELKNFGYETVFNGVNGTSKVQYSTKATLSDKARLRSITAYVGGANDQLRYAIYSDSNGQPNKLLAQSETGSTATEMAWVTLSVPEIDLAPGNYWLSYSFKNSNQKYRYISSYSGAGERNVSNDAVGQGFLDTWGTSKNSYSGARSIYATYEVLP